MPAAGRNILLLALLAALCAGLAGAAPFARLLQRAGYPDLALPWIDDGAAHGAALYEAGRYAEADDAFRRIGRSVTYNRGNSLAATGDYRLSVAYFDAVLFANRFDAAARHNREVVAALVPPAEGEAMGRGRIQTFLRESGLDAAGFDDDNPHASVVADPESFRKAVEARTVAAGRAWLDTLSDAPGEYLRARLEAERDRRRAAGKPAPPAASPW